MLLDPTQPTLPTEDGLPADPTPIELPTAGEALRDASPVAPATPAPVMVMPMAPAAPLGSVMMTPSSAAPMMGMGGATPIPQATAAAPPPPPTPIAQAYHMGVARLQYDTQYYGAQARYMAALGAGRAFQDLERFGQRQEELLTPSATAYYDPEETSFLGSLWTTLAGGEHRNLEPGESQAKARKDLAERLAVGETALLTEGVLPTVLGGLGAAAGSAFLPGPGTVGGLIGGAALGIGADMVLNADVVKDHFARGAFIEEASDRFMRTGQSTALDGRGFDREEVGEVVNFLEAVGDRESFFSKEELDGLMRDLTSRGLFDDSRSVDDFKAKFTKAKDNLQAIMQQVGVSIEEGTQLLSDLSQVGVGEYEVPTVLRQLEMASNRAGLDVSQTTGWAVQGAVQALQGTGIDYRLGVGLQTSNLAQMGLLETFGHVGGQSLQELGGAAGAAAMMTQYQAASVDNPVVQRALMASYTGGGELNQQVFEDILSGEMSVGEQMQRVRDNMLDPQKKLEFRARLPELVSTLEPHQMQQMAALPLLEYADRVGEHGLEATPELLESYAMGTLGMSKAQAEVAVATLDRPFQEELARVQQEERERTLRDSYDQRAIDSMQSSLRYVNPNNWLRYGGSLWQDHVIDPITSWADDAARSYEEGLARATGQYTYTAHEPLDDELMRELYQRRRTSEQALKGAGLDAVMGGDQQQRDPGPGMVISEDGNAVRRDHLALRLASLKNFQEDLSAVADEEPPEDLVSLLQSDTGTADLLDRMTTAVSEAVEGLDADQQAAPALQAVIASADQLGLDLGRREGQELAVGALHAAGVRAPALGVSLDQSLDYDFKGLIGTTRTLLREQGMTPGMLSTPDERDAFIEDQRQTRGTTGAGFDFVNSVEEQGRQRATSMTGPDKLIDLRDQGSSLLRVTNRERLLAEYGDQAEWVPLATLPHDEEFYLLDQKEAGMTDGLLDSPFESSNPATRLAAYEEALPQVRDDIAHIEAGGATHEIWNRFVGRSRQAGLDIPERLLIHQDPTDLLEELRRHEAVFSSEEGTLLEQREQLGDQFDQEQVMGLVLSTEQVDKDDRDKQQANRFMLEQLDAMTVDPREREQEVSDETTRAIDLMTATTDRADVSKHANEEMYAYLTADTDEERATALAALDDKLEALGEGEGGRAVIAKAIQDPAMRELFEGAVIAHYPSGRGGVETFAELRRGRQRLKAGLETFVEEEAARPTGPSLTTTQQVDVRHTEAYQEALDLYDDPSKWDQAFGTTDRVDEFKVGMAAAAAGQLPAFAEALQEDVQADINRGLLTQDERAAFDRFMEGTFTPEDIQQFPTLVTRINEYASPTTEAGQSEAGRLLQATIGSGLSELDPESRVQAHEDLNRVDYLSGAEGLAQEIDKVDRHIAASVDRVAENIGLDLSLSGLLSGEDERDSQHPHQRHIASLRVKALGDLPTDEKSAIVRGGMFKDFTGEVFNLARIKREYDTDGDGTLSDEEKEALDANEEDASKYARLMGAVLEGMEENQLVAEVFDADQLRQELDQLTSNSYLLSAAANDGTLDLFAQREQLFQQVMNNQKGLTDQQWEDMQDRGGVLSDWRVDESELPELRNTILLSKLSQDQLMQYSQLGSDQERASFLQEQGLDQVESDDIMEYFGGESRLDWDEDDRRRNTLALFESVEAAEAAGFDTDEEEWAEAKASVRASADQAEDNRRAFGRGAQGGDQALLNDNPVTQELKSLLVDLNRNQDTITASLSKVVERLNNMKKEGA